MALHLHIVSFDIPWPPNYGGIIDVFFAVKHLRKAGVKIILHAFQYNDRKKSKELEALCESVHYYKRPIRVLDQLSRTPFIIKTRKNPHLLKRLKADQHPILFQGLHTCAYYKHPALKDRLKVIRMHNVEWKYYNGLARIEKDPFKKTYFKWESKKLRRFEQALIPHADMLVSISENETAFFKQYNADVHYIPAFHPYEQVETQIGQGKFALFHGKLSVQDNEEQVRFLADEVFKGLDYKLVVAGLDPSKQLMKFLNKHPNISLEPNVSTAKMNQLMKDAQFHILLSGQSEGMKLKLINALHKGRHILVNSKIVNKTGLENLCHIADDANALKQLIISKQKLPFSKEDLEQRAQVLGTRFNPQANADRLKMLIESRLVEDSRKNK